ncbi:hypothetical protein GF389_05325 [Candidatus Dojkabacteria bacterium]|nr:hypothetical protein [Candidatus Dojkabacteria bacterium]
MANSGTIESGESLGSFTIRTGDVGDSVSIVRASENGYLVGSVMESQTGTVGTYTVGTSTVTTLPATAIIEDPKYVIVLGALSLIFAGLLIYRIYPILKNNEKIV